MKVFRHRLADFQVVASKSSYTWPKFCVFFDILTSEDPAGTQNLQGCLGLYDHNFS